MLSEEVKTAVVAGRDAARRYPVPVIDIKRFGIKLHAGEPCPEVPREPPVGDGPVAVENAGVGERVRAEA